MPGVGWVVLWGVLWVVLWVVLWGVVVWMRRRRVRRLVRRVRPGVLSIGLRRRLTVVGEVVLLGGGRGGAAGRWRRSCARGAWRRERRGAVAASPARLAVRLELILQRA